MCKSQESFKWALQPLHGPLSYRPRNFGHRESSTPLQETGVFELVRGIASETELIQLPRGVGPSFQPRVVLCVLFRSKQGGEFFFPFGESTPADPQVFE